MSRSLIVRFVLAGLVPLLAASALLFMQQRSAAFTQAEQTAQSQAATTARDLARDFQSWRTELLVASNNPVLRQWFAKGADTAALRVEVNRALLELSSVNPGLVDEACFISATGQELGREVKGTAAPISDLSPSERVNAFFAATFQLAFGQVHQHTPYISADSHRWVISNSTPIVLAGRKVALLHFETNVDSIRARVAAIGGSRMSLRVVDTRTSKTIVDSRSSRPIVTQNFAKAATRPLQSGWAHASAAIAAPDGNDNHWRVEVAVEAAAAINATLLTRLAGLVLLMCIALIFLARRSARAIVTPLRRIAAVAAALARGDRDQRVEVVGHDEIAQVGAAFNTMVDGLAQQDATLAATQREREDDLLASVEHQRVSEEKLRERAQDAIDETAHSVTHELQQLSAQVDLVRQGAATIEERVSAADAVTRAVIEQARNADHVVAELQSSLRDVDGMTRLIAGVADQTKLLALNATIEAARAGEAGRGFSVVADEVKELAMTTARSTDQITATLTTLNAHSSAVAQAIAAMGSGIADVGDAAGQLHEVAQQQFQVVDALNAQVEGTRDRVTSMSRVTTRLERRAYPRFPISGPVQVSVAGRTVGGTLVDISEGGLHLRTKGAGLRVGQSGSAAFELDGRELTVHDRVVTCDTASGVDDVGMSFEDAPAQVTSAIHAYLDHQR